MNQNKTVRTKQPKLLSRQRSRPTCARKSRPALFFARREDFRPRPRRIGRSLYACTSQGTSSACDRSRQTAPDTFRRCSCRRSSALRLRARGSPARAAEHRARLLGERAREPIARAASARMTLARNNPSSLETAAPPLTRNGRALARVPRAPVATKDIAGGGERAAARRGAWPPASPARPPRPIAPPRRRERPAASAARRSARRRTRGVRSRRAPRRAPPVKRAAAAARVGPALRGNPPATGDGAPMRAAHAGVERVGGALLRSGSERGDRPAAQQARRASRRGAARAP